MKALSLSRASPFNAHSGISSHAGRQLLTTLGDSGLLYLIAFGIHTTRALQSAFASPLWKTPSKAFLKADTFHPNSSAKAISPAWNRPGTLLVCGPVNKKIQRYFPEGDGEDRSRNLPSPHIRVSIFR